MSPLPFQDITAQQLSSASTVLEDRMARLAEVFDRGEDELRDLA
jgi:hypothetical protein